MADNTDTRTESQPSGSAITKALAAKRRAETFRRNQRQWRGLDAEGNRETRNDKHGLCFDVAGLQGHYGWYGSSSAYYHTMKNTDHEWPFVVQALGDKIGEIMERASDLMDAAAQRQIEAATGEAEKVLELARAGAAS